MSAEAVRSVATTLDSQGNKSFSSTEDSKTTQSVTSTNTYTQSTPNKHPKFDQSNSGSKLLKQLLQDTSSRFVSHVEEVWSFY